MDFGNNVMDLHNIPLNQILFNAILYVCLPLWLVMGFLDYWCHRKSKIELTTGMRESALHALMGVQVGVPIFLGLFFKINVMLLLVMFAVLLLHEWVAHHDVKYALHTREISIMETHVHSFLEVLPFTIVGLIICMNWPAFVDLFTLHWADQMTFIWRERPINLDYIVSYVLLLLFADVLPFVEEFVRCWHHRDQLKTKPNEDVSL